jgi:hypothetical protein
MSPAGHVAGGGDYQTTSPAAATIRPQPGGAARRCGATVRRDGAARQCGVTVLRGGVVRECCVPVPYRPARASASAAMHFEAVTCRTSKGGTQSRGVWGGAVMRAGADIAGLDPGGEGGVARLQRHGEAEGEGRGPGAGARAHARARATQARQRCLPCETAPPPPPHPPFPRRVPPPSPSRSSAFAPSSEQPPPRPRSRLHAPPRQTAESLASLRRPPTGGAVARGLAPLPDG